MRVAGRSLIAVLAAAGLLAMASSQPASAACGFTRTPSPNAGDGSNFPVAVDATSSDNAWVLGSRDKPGDTYDWAQTWNWNGSRWKLVKVPHPKTAYTVNVRDITALKNGDAWLVGSWWDITFSQIYPFLAHYEGGHWSIVKVPKPLRIDSAFSGIDARSPDDIWITGNHGSDPFVLHFDGTRWRRMSVPAVGTTSDSLSDVTVVPRSKHVWIAGNYSGPPVEAAYFARWNGREWKAFPASQPASQVVVYSINAAAKDDVWATGYLTDQVHTWGGSSFHFDGSAWTYWPTPDPSLSFPGTSLHGVAAIDDTHAYAIGSTYSSGSGPSWQQGIIVDMWDGVAWTQSTLPAVQIPAIGRGVARIPGTEKVWIVGAEFDGSDHVSVFMRGC